MRETKISALITLVIIFVVSALLSIAFSNQSDFIQSLGIVAFLLGLLGIVVGIILTIISTTRKYGQGILIGAGIWMLIGFSLCSGGFSNMK